MMARIVMSASLAPTAVRRRQRLSRHQVELGHLLEAVARPWRRGAAGAALADLEVYRDAVRVDRLGAEQEVAVQARRGLRDARPA
jgi:hypothetical protein